MACCSFSFPATTKAKYPAPSSSSNSAVSVTVSPSSSSCFSSSKSISHSHLFPSSSRGIYYQQTLVRRRPPNFQVVSSGNKPGPLKVMISGAPASGKGTQCQLITKKDLLWTLLFSPKIPKSPNLTRYGLVHIAAGDLLRAEISSGSENGKQAKEYMEKGQLVPNEIVVMMVKERLSQPDSQENGWLLDGYPRSLSQATALQEFGFQPDIFILLEVPEDNLVERVVGRRLDPVTGRIYHLKYSPPETEEIASRLTQRFDDTEEKVKLRLQTHHQNVESVLSMFEDVTVKVNGNVSKEEVFAQIDSALTQLLEQKQATLGSMAA